MDNQLLHEYINGNYLVRLYGDGTKERLFNETPNPIFPESIDLKITDKCELNCHFCHEGSSILGKHSDIFRVCSLLNTLPFGREIACGGGNCLLHPQIYTFLLWLKSKNLVANMTINAKQLITHEQQIFSYVDDKLIYGLGISYNNKYKVDLSKFLTNNSVIHLIAGFHTVDDLTTLIDRYNHLKVLILGYKIIGRGSEYFATNKSTILKNLEEWNARIYDYLSKDNIIISFDNLALEQLNIKRFFANNSWAKHYMGDDGQFTMYIDAVKQEYAGSSTSINRYNINPRDNIQSMFYNIKKL